MEPPQCDILGCPAQAQWLRITGFDGGSENYLCDNHWRQTRLHDTGDAACFTSLPRHVSIPAALGLSDETGGEEDPA